MKSRDLLELPVGTRIEFQQFDDFKRYVDWHGYWADRPVSRPGYYSMVRQIGPSAHQKPPTPRDFRFEIVTS